MSNIRSEFHTNLVTKMQEDTLYRRRYLYYFLGVIDAWDDELTPPAEPILTNKNDTNIRDNIVFVGLVNPTDTSLVIPRHDWVSGTVFAQWDDTKELIGINFYCVTDEFNVYKCLNNNAGAPSLVKPTGESLIPFETTDGYTWKFMYNVPLFKRSKFTSAGYIPVQRALTESFLNKGAIESVVVSNGGTGYVSTPLTTIELSSPTTGAGAIARVRKIGRYGEITELAIDSPGAGYTLGSRANITSEFGVGAELKTINSPEGALIGFEIVNSGFNYKPGDVVNITVGGGVLLPVISKTTGSIIDVLIQDAGIGYTRAPTLVVKQFGTSGTGKFGNATAVLRSRVTNGSIDHIIIDDPGINYPSDSATTIVVQGDGTGAVIEPIIYNGVIVGTVVESPGQNYTYATLRVVGDGSGAQLTSVLSGSDISSTQSIVEQTTMPGSIHAIEIIESGEGYPYTRVNIVGDGSGAIVYAKVDENGRIADIVIKSIGSDYTTALIDVVSSHGNGALLTAIIKDGSIVDITIDSAGSGYRLPAVLIDGDGLNASATALVAEDGTIERVFMESYGEGYTNVNISFFDPNRPEPSLLIDATAYAVLPPYGGHGFNAPQELLTDTICIFSALRQEELLLAVNQDYRQYGLIEDPLSLYSNKRISNKSNVVTFRVTVARETSVLAVDQVLLCNNKRYRIVKIEGTTLTLIQQSSIYQIPVGEFTPVDNLIDKYPIINIEEAPTVDKYSGNLLYITNKPPFTTTDTQSVAIRTYLKL